MRNAGFTLIEMMMVTAIMSVILFAVSVVMNTASTELAVSMPETDLQKNSQRVVMQMAEALAEASAGRLNVAAGTDWVAVTFKVPVDPDAAGGDPLNDDYTVCWGARWGDSEAPGGRNAFVWQKTGAVDEATEIPGGLNININTEAAGTDATRDMTDVFHLGRLVFIYDPDASFPPTLNGDETVHRLTGDWVVQTGDAGSFGGDIDGDENADPLFVVSGGTVEINVWGLHVIKHEKTAVLVNSKTRVKVRND